ncbi:PP2C family protein-serine/threonine phosphatase [Methylobacterium dankookense]|uniref:PP2C-family Ser/Thr phosphatase n=1 Tax=Methylobacterium dankookense TaxID=560405 RepID=A0A564FVM2_9HYPH|nr:PP2C family serine/threonine-protein phosphatase [Methylobacterium dankookense]GJD57291.1 Protein phosphatase PrpC [Methylobacterium dankookense]VUF11730.1 PP2C-family Ser/Thr phosphatase [Methylobacterium dankookense]
MTGTLPIDLLQIECGSLSHPGKVRSENEDCCLVAPEIGVFAVADGMGGHEDGALASSTVVGALASIGAAVSAADLMARFEDRILRANAVLRSAGLARSCVVGSTAAVLLIFGRDFACLWSGDSRVYRIRGEAIEQLTRDHTEGRDLFERGILSAAEMAAWPRRHVLTRAVGVRDRPEMDLEQGQVMTGDIFVLCSDGLTGHVEDRDILLAAGTSAPQWACAALVDLTLERGASDNVTVVVIRCSDHGEPAGRPAAASPATVMLPVRPAGGGAS